MGELVGGQMGPVGPLRLQQFFRQPPFQAVGQNKVEDSLALEGGDGDILGAAGTAALAAGRAEVCRPIAELLDDGQVNCLFHYVMSDNGEVCQGVCTIISLLGPMSACFFPVSASLEG